MITETGTPPTESGAIRTSRVAGSTTCFICNVPEGELILGERELDLAGLTRREPYALEAFELTHRPCHAGTGQADVALDHLGPFAFARVGDAAADLDRRTPGVDRQRR